MSKSIRKWHDLPQELIELILKNLFYLDHLRFRAVCKGWRSMYGVPSLYLLPMFMIWHQDTFIPSKIFDPVYKKTFSIHPNCDVLIKDETMDICASNFGWLLFCKQHITNYVHSSAATSFFFFVNPFTGETIDLPPLPNNGFGIATFTSPPTSNNCIVLNYYPIPFHDRFSIISTIFVGDNAWNSTKCYNPVDYHPTNNVVLLDKLFYFVSCTGNLATFNIVERTWNLLDVPLKWSLYCTHLVKSGEELLLVCAGSNNVFKFDFTKMSWIHMASLKGGTLFLGTTSSFSALPSEATSKMGDRLYYANVPPMFSTYRFEFYSMRSGRMFSGVASYGDVAGHCPKSTHLCKKLWIEPPPLS